MENDMEYRTLINELTQGMELTKQLKGHLNSVEIREMLISRIISSYERALLVLKWHRPSSPVRLPHPQAVSPTTPGMGEGSVFANGSPHREASSSKKRKAMPTWTDQVRVSSDYGLDGPVEDGYSWRKYGQKDILGANYPRSYYRCTYRDTQSCWATKQVQRSDDDPAIFDITYRGKHSCNLHGSSGDPSPGKGKEEVQPIHNHNIPQPNDLLLNLSTNLKVNTGNFENEDFPTPFTFPLTSSECMTIGDPVGDNPLGSFSPPFISPATSETSYFSVSPCQMNSSNGDLSEIISANNSATNSPMMDDWDFLILSANLETKFPFYD